MVEVDSLPALQVIVLGSGGGPKEDNTTAFLVRSTAAGWKRGSVLAVDAGVHLAAITRILEGHSSDYSPNNESRAVTLIEGPFEGLEIPHSSATANAAHITRTLIDTYLITHPHLDHISSLIVNTASLPGSRPKRIAALPFTISALKNHIFNGIIWPNLSDENNGAGLVTYMRLVDGGSPALGEGDGKGYVEICEGLSVKTWSVSHGHCIENHSHRGSNAGLHSPAHLDGTVSQISLSSRSAPGGNLSPVHLTRSDSRSSSGPNMAPGTARQLFEPYERFCVTDSSAYFIRDIATGREVLIFGDVEADSISLSPRNKQVWMDAAPKIVSGKLGGIFIECSYDDSQADDTLFGHLAPRFLIEELKALANELVLWQAGQIQDSKKRKRMSNGSHPEIRPRRSTRSLSGQPSTSTSEDFSVSPRSQRQFRHVSHGVTPSEINDEHMHDAQTLPSHVIDSTLPMRSRDNFPLKGIKVVIIHMKEKLDDGPDVGETILQQMKEYDEEARLGCEFIISRAGQAIYL